MFGSPPPVNRSARLLAYLLTQEVVAGSRTLDTPVVVPEGVRPFDEICDVVAGLCDRLAPDAVEIALVLRREGFDGTVESLLGAAARLAH